MMTDPEMGTEVAVGEEGQGGVVLVGAVVVLMIVIDVIRIVDGLRDVGGVEVVGVGVGVGVGRLRNGEVGEKAKGRPRRFGSDLWLIEMNEVNLFFGCIFRTAICDDVFFVASLCIFGSRTLSILLSYGNGTAGAANVL